MKVLCISLAIIHDRIINPIIKVGEIYTVIDSGPGHLVSDNKKINDWYELSEDRCYLYDQALFIPISSIDETEMIRNYQTENV